MRFLAIAIIAIASMIGSVTLLPLCPSTKRTPPAEVGRCTLVAMVIGAIAGGGLAAVPVTIAWIAGRKKGTRTFEKSSVFPPD